MLNYLDNDDCRLLLSSEKELAGRLLLRPLIPSDLPNLKSICKASFPIQYPESWYEEVVSGSLITLALFDGLQMAGVMVAEVKRIDQCNVEDRDILNDSTSHVIYILSLAVNRPYRRQGLASKLLHHLLESIVDFPPYPRAIFLHVLASNTTAINFYKANGFVQHDMLLNYYRIDDCYGDAYTYVKYTNGARAPINIGYMCRMFAQALCFPIKRICTVFS